MIKITDFPFVSLKDEISLFRDYYYDDLLETQEPEFLLVGNHSTRRVPLAELQQLDKELKIVWEHLIRLRRIMHDSSTANGEEPHRGDANT